MKKLQLASLIVLALSVVLWTAGRTLFPLPDWTVRLNGVIMMITMALFVFASVRLHIRKEG
ncbi:MAG: hypothetical protein K2M15_04795 [Oscillospiraceae bacterium]|nr:hypothetical protein [Oscillospiraceae bacterium]MDE7171234.1 hypothetical protein [Oscillospiraceae bacterium]